jgi:hypothetical protein
MDVLRIVATSIGVFGAIAFYVFSAELARQPRRVWMPLLTLTLAAGLFLLVDGVYRTVT